MFGRQQLKSEKRRIYSLCHEVRTLGQALVDTQLLLEDLQSTQSTKCEACVSPGQLPDCSPSPSGKAKTLWKSKFQGLRKRFEGQKSRASDVVDSPSVRRQAEKKLGQCLEVSVDGEDVPVVVREDEESDSESIHQQIALQQHMLRQQQEMIVALLDSLQAKQQEEQMRRQKRSLRVGQLLWGSAVGVAAGTSLAVMLKTLKNTYT